jgi:putative ABC transport system permease protein
MLATNLWQDLRYAARALLRTPAFTIAALLGLALGIGATSAIFSVVNGVLLTPLPLGSPARIVAILHQYDNPVAPANFIDWKRSSTSFERMGAAEYWSPTLTSGGAAAERIQALRLTTDALALANVPPMFGRLFAPGEDTMGRDHEVVLSWGLWQRRFAGDRGIVGRTIQLDGNPYAVIGVMPQGFDFPMFWAHDVQLWAPLALGARSSDRSANSLRVLARLRPGVTLGQARAEIAEITASLERVYPGTNRDVNVSSLRDLIVGDVRPALLVLLGAVVLVLLLACANVAHMLLARGAARQREVTIRAAIGASRVRIVRQLLTESMLLGVIGGVLGLAVAASGVRFLVALGGIGLPRVEEVTLDARVVVFTILVSMATGLIFGLAPAMRSSRVQLADSLRESTRGSGGGARQNRLRDALVASEFALALVLLTGAGLAIRTFVALRSIDPGFDPRGVVTMIVPFAGTAEASPGRRVAFIEQLVERVRALPGVERASAINHVPIVGDRWGLGFYIEGRPIPRPGEVPSAAYRVALPGYFAAMHIPVLEGRDFSEADRSNTPGVVVIDDYMARHYWPGESAVGKRLTLDTPGPKANWLTVIGVVKNAVQSDWAAPAREELYVPWLQEGHYLTGMGGEVGYMTLVVRTACRVSSPCDAASLVGPIRGVVASFDANIPVAQVWTMDQVVAAATSRSRFTLVLLAAFAAVALLLATVGVYGVMSYAVSRRTHEIGVRLALGAAPGTIVSMIVREGMVVALTGAALGMGGALLLTRSMTSFLYGVKPSDPVTLVGVASVLAAAALLAAYIPARAAARTDPLAALRAE